MGLLLGHRDRSSRPRACPRTRCASSRPRRTSPNGCSIGASRAYRAWLEMEEVDWAKLDVPAIDYQDAYYYAAPKAKPKLGSLDEVDPENPARLCQARHPDRGAEGARGGRGRAQSRGRRRVRFGLGRDHFPRGIEARRGHLPVDLRSDPRNIPKLIKKYLGSVVPQRDNVFACLNAAVFSDGTFVLVPEGVRCPMETLDLFPHQRRKHRPVRAHADRRRKGQLRILPRRLPPRRCATRTSFTPPSSKSSPTRMPR